MKTFDDLTQEDVLPYLQTEDAAAPEAEATVDIPPETATAAPEAEPMAEPDIATEAALRATQALQAANQRIAELEALQAQMSTKAEDKIEETIIEPPVLDMTNFAYMTDEERKAAQTAYSQQMMDFVSKNVDKGLKPVVDYVSKQKTSAEEQSVITDLKTKQPDFEKYLPEVQSFLASNVPIAQNLSKLPARDKLITAYLMIKGNEAISVKKTPEQTAEEIYANPDVMRTLKLKEQAALKQNANVPAQTASSGMANIPITPPKTPKTWEEAEELSLKYYG